jgi:tetratricopeptide (TPR) repeat protein
LAALYLAQERWKEAEELYGRALANREGAWGPWAREIPPNVSKLAETHFRQGRLDVSEQLFVRFIELTEKKLGKKHPEIKPFLLGYAGLLRLANQPERAASLEERAGLIPDLPKPSRR